MASLRLGGWGLLAALAGCSPALAPQLPNMPLLSEAGDVSALGHVSTTGLEVQTAYALSPSWTLTADGLVDVRPNKERRLWAAAAGLGYGVPVGTHRRLSLYGGGGLGGGRSGYSHANLYFIDTDAGRLKSRYWQAYLQPTYTQDFRPVSVGVALRASYARFTTLRSTVLPPPGSAYGPDIYDGNHLLYLQGAVQLGFEVNPHVRFITSAGLQLPAEQQYARGDNFSRFTLGMGVQWHRFGATR